MTANTWQTYTGGRIIAYFAVGIIQNAVPSYQAECSPAGLRGFFAGFMHIMTGLGNLWGSGMGRAYATETGPKGYLICTGVQFIPAFLLFALVPFCPRQWYHRRPNTVQGENTYPGRTQNHPDGSS